MPDTTTVTALADAVAAFDPQSLTDDVVEQTKLLVLDTLGCAIAAEGVPLIDDVRNAVSALGGAPQASLIGGDGKTSVLNAILANGAMVRVLDLNDYNIMEGEDGAPAMGGHPSDNIPVALAAAEWRRCSGLEAIGGIVISYEIVSRMKDIIERDRQFDGTSVSGIAVPAMVGQMMGLGPGPLAHAIAFGAARCMAPPLMRRGQISSGKSLANALIAQSGTLGCLLAAEGATGPLQVLDHELGIRALFRDDADLSVLSEPYAGASAILANHVKAYPCVATGQAAVAAALELHDKVKGQTRSIAGIDIIMSDYAYVRGQQTDPGRSNPQSHAAADHCFPFTVAVALVDGEMTPRQYENERWFDPEIVALMGRTTMGNDAALNEKAPVAFPCRVEVTMEDGAKHAAEVLFPPGYSKGRLDRGEVIEKFEAFTGPMISDARMEAIKNLALRLDELESVDELMAALSERIG
ncbi:MAG: MmgE/PrpD family protein [Alphaproteobacteria bacterium]|nr:MmgE/PrpD family protein [Alphaproteobacteria bacterium]